MSYLKVITFPIVAALLAGCAGETVRSPDFVGVLKTIEVSPSAAEIAPGTSKTFSAMGCFTTPPSRGDTLTCRDITDSVEWSSSAEDVAVSAGPRAVAKRRGISEITAASGDVSGNADLDVSGAVIERLEISPGTSEVPVGLTQKFVATGILVEDGVEVGSQDVSDDVEWNSESPSVAPIDQNGVATGQVEGGTLVTAQMLNIEGDEISDDAPLDVTSAVLQKVTLNLEPEREDLPEGSRKIFRSYGYFSDDSCRNVSYEISQDPDPDIGFFSSDDSVVRMDPYDDNTGGVSAYGVPRDPSRVDPPPPASDEPADTRPVVDDSFCNPPAAASEKLATEKESLGDVTVTSTFRDFNGNLLVDTAAIFLSSAEVHDISVVPADGSDPAAVQPGFELPFIAVANYTDGSSIDVTQDPTTLWTSGDNDTAIVGNQQEAGLVVGVAPGDVTINATFDGVTGADDLTVLDGFLDAIALGPDLFCIAGTRVPETVASDAGDQIVPGGQKVAAIGTFTSGLVLDVSEDVLWTAQYGVWNNETDECAEPFMPTSSPADVSNAEGERGAVTAEAQLLLGTSCILASHANTGVIGGGTAIVIPVLDDDIAETQLCEAIMPLLTLGESVTPGGAGIPVELVGLVGQLLQPVLTNLQLGEIDAQDVVHEVVGLVGQLTDPLTPITSPLLDGLRDFALNPALSGAHDLLCALIPDDSCN